MFAGACVVSVMVTQVVVVVAHDFVITGSNWHLEEF